jgi:hypothetical protein
MKFQSETSESCRTITKASVGKQGIPLLQIKTEMEKLGHKVTNIWNIKQYRTKLPLSMFFACPNNKDIFSLQSFWPH